MNKNRHPTGPAGMTRRRFLATAAGSALAAAFGGLPRFAGAAEPLILPPLPFGEGALEPVISARTISFHYGKHHRGYFDNLLRLIAGTEYAGMPLDRIVAATAGRPDRAAIFNNAAQTWNHTFYWRSLKPKGGGEPPAGLKRRIESSFGSVGACRKALAEAAAAQFGSGWAWLIRDGGTLKAARTPNAEIPAGKEVVPLLVIDVWEHAYYLDYQNRRAAYVEALIEKLLNWEFAAGNLGAA
ncbi:MAG: superoxide dismutase [bacterium]|nr:superoxide dismutase [bacterium]